MTAAVDPATLLVVIPCLNEEAHLPRLLAQLVADVPGAAIIVADGGSSDRGPEFVADFARRHPEVQLLHNPQRVQSAGINLAAVRHGQGKAWLVRIDAHCDYPDGYVSGLVESAVARGAGSVVVPMITHGTSCFQIACATAQNSVIGTGGSAHRHRGEGRYVDHGHHALMRLDLFRRVGGYREALSHNEDAELDLRLAAAGARIWLEPRQAIVYHPRRTPLALLRQYFNYGQGRARTVRLHATGLKPRQAAPLAVPVAVGLALLAPFHPLFALPALCWATLCLGFGLLLGLRARSLCAAGSGVAAMIMHFGWGLGYLRERARGRPPEPAMVALPLG
jgi:succinoglycan biosynthesis protein ExoA